MLPGSLLGLTGVYAGLGGDRTTGRNINAFELLLNSPSNIHVYGFAPCLTNGR